MTTSVTVMERKSLYRCDALYLYNSLNIVMPRTEDVFLATFLTLACSTSDSSRFFHSTPRTTLLCRHSHHTAPRQRETGPEAYS